ncbi:MAG: phosphomannomutase/phosphoglucomutase [Desulfobacteraceae bacterium]|nr:MAG: phosphomannomutase/phosphoglucomutase [Desulfobacteraceae bacterium]
MVNPSIFREYDIRGRVPDELNEDTAYQLGRAFGTYYHQHGISKVSLGHDCRLSSPMLYATLEKALVSCGLEVIKVGMVPTPLLYFSLFELNLDGGVQITGSHNPPDHNGFKVCLHKTTIYGDEIQKLRTIAESGAFTTGRGSVRETDVIKPYIEYLKTKLPKASIKRKVVVDAGNGVGGLAAPQVYENMGVEVEKLFCEPDGRFPNHHPDPTVLKNLEALIKRVAETQADFGIGLDGDADRIGVVDRTGRIIWGDLLLLIFSRAILKEHPGAAIVGEVKCSQVLFDDIRKHGGRAIMWKAGHSLIKGKMKEEQAVLGGEMSGHLFFADRYFGYDDAIYAGARLIEIMTHTEQELHEFLADVPVLVNTPEIRMDCPDEKKFQVVADLVADFKKDYEVIDIDGARVVFDDGWGLVRASNTQPVLVLRFEARTEQRLQAIKQLFMDKVRAYM